MPVLRRFRPVRPLLGAAAALSILAAPLAAQEVRLVSTDGFIDFTGTLLSFEDGVYVIDTRMGRLSLPAAEVSCEGEACPQANEVASAFSIAGSPAMLRLLIPDMLDSYSLDADTDIQRTEAPDGTVGYQLLTFDGAPVAEVSLSDAAPRAAAAQLAYGDTALAILPGRLAEAQARALGLSVDALARRGFETRIASDALVVVVGAEVGIEALRLEELAAIYAGEITNWSAIGGPDMPISVFAPAEISDVSALLGERVMEPARKRVAPDVIRLETSDTVAEAVARFPNAIGVGALSRIAEGGIAIADACGAAVPPTEAAVRTARYPLGFDYYVYASPGGVPVHALGLVDFAKGPLGQELVATAGFLDLELRELDGAGMGRGALTEGAQPLSVALTVAGTGTPLDPVDIDGLDRLAEMVRAGKAEGKELIFLGIGGPDGEAAALRAARAALRALFAAHSDVEEQLTVAFSVHGIAGGGAGGACTDGLGSDSRVEIWARPLPGSG